MGRHRASFQAVGGPQVELLIAAIVLAAGKSERLGRPKQLLELDGRPVLQHVVDAVARSRVDDVVVVLGHERERIESAIVVPPRARVIFNPSFAEGQSTSVRRGLEEVGDAGAAAFVVGDQPRVSADVIDRVIDAWRASTAPVARAYFNGTPGHPVVVSRSHWNTFMSVSGDAGGRDAMDAGLLEVLPVELGIEPLDDIDTWADYERVSGRRSLHVTD
jgi:molybdenum cofactor cytidylyltransferase